MAGSGERKHDERGLSARYLVLVFLMGVAACGVFFSLGFLVGYNERSSKTAGMTEQHRHALADRVRAVIASALPSASEPQINADLAR